MIEMNQIITESNNGPMKEENKETLKTAVPLYFEAIEKLMRLRYGEAKNNNKMNEEKAYKQLIQSGPFIDDSGYKWSWKDDVLYCEWPGGGKTWYNSFPKP